MCFSFAENCHQKQGILFVLFDILWMNALMSGWQIQISHCVLPIFIILFMLLFRWCVFVSSLFLCFSVSCHFLIMCFLILFMFIFSLSFCLCCCFLILFMLLFPHSVHVYFFSLILFMLLFPHSVHVCFILCVCTSWDCISRLKIHYCTKTIVFSKPWNNEFKFKFLNQKTNFIYVPPGS